MKLVKMCFDMFCYRARMFALLVGFSLAWFSLTSNGQACDNSGSLCQTPIQNLTSSASLVNLTVSSTCSSVYAYPDTSGVDVPCSAGMFPKENMLDTEIYTAGTKTIVNPNLKTYWQSENTLNGSATPITEYVILNFSATYLIRSMVITFITPPTGIRTFTDMRPLAMQFMAWSDVTNQWVSWRYYADNCFFRYQLAASQGPVDPTLGGLDPICVQKFYSGDGSTFVGDGDQMQEVAFDPAYEFPIAYESDVDVQHHFITSALRFQFDYPSKNISKLSYYSIAAVSVEWQCACYGHASACLPGTGQCVCQHNTMGVHCEECLPNFNNRPWMMGVITVNSTLSACQDCNCSGFAASCHYDPFYGQGICDSCTSNTTGFKCESCVPSYFVNPNWNPASVNASCVGIVPPLLIPMIYDCNGRCIPCNCSSLGSDPNSFYQCDALSGNCSCKVNVQGRACDTCKDGFWNLDGQNFLGCSGCNCEPSGSLNSINFCDRISGTCICKNFTQGTRCDSCMIGYFNIDITNPSGCSLCDCDLGASLGLVCPAAGGACTCKALVSGRTCRDPVPGYFGPSLDYLTFEAEFSSSVAPAYIVERYGAGDINATNTGRGFVNLSAQRSLSMSMTVPFASLFTFIVRYESNATWTAVPAVLQLSNAAAAPYVCGTGTTYQATQSFSANFPQKSVAGAVVMGTPCFLANIPYNLLLTFPSSIPLNSAILIDSVVLIPVLSNSSAYILANDSVKAQMQQCSVSQQSVGYPAAQNLSCPQFGYSIMVDKFGQAVDCACNSTGSVNAVCNPLGGLCPCLPNVFLRDCSQCKVNSYGFSNGLGCTACNCDPNGSSKSACDSNGICSCRSNVVGVTCNVCIPQYWGVFTGNGCQPCQCNLNFALDNSCMDSGQCYCLPGVGGINCDRCADGYYQLTTSGCTWCGCNSYGSQTINCVPADGHCICKTQAVGFTCNTCPDGYFALGPWGDNGCIPCFCSGHSNNCSSAFGYYQMTINTRLDLLNGAVVRTNEWSAQDQSGNPIPVTNPTLFTDTTNAVRTMTIQTNFSGTFSYFVAPSAYLGNKQSAYGQNLTMTVMLSTPPLANGTLSPVPATGDVFIQGNYTSYALVASYPALPLPNTATSYSFRLHESVWFLNSSTSLIRVPATYQQMVQVLASIKSIQVRATIYQLLGQTDNNTVINSSLIYASLTFANSSAPVSDSQTLASNVEQCICPVGYQGQFCESCALGYTRMNPSIGMFSPCVQCFCYNHEAPGTTCDPETGACVCQDNTNGTKCDSCNNGYYGYPISGRVGACQPCMCPGNVPFGAINAFATTCHNDGLGGYICDNCTGGANGSHCDACSYGFFGTPTNISNNMGRCGDCSGPTYCSGNAGYNQTCNSTTGDCLSCIFNTTGRYCDVCLTNFTGLGYLRNCKPCNCNSSIGMTGDCDKLTASCFCKPNVVSLIGTCDSCTYGSFNYSSGNGCLPCNCSALGSSFSSPYVCDQVSGACTCNPAYTGVKCDTCVSGYYYVSSGCAGCGCNMNDGSTNNSVCDPVTGQCPCNPGFTGRLCNVCEAGKNATLPYIGNLTLGIYPICVSCGMCYDNLAGLISQLGINMDTSYRQIMNLWTSSYQNENYNTVLAQVTSVAVAVNSSSLALNQITNYFPVFQGLQSNFSLVASSIYSFTLKASTNNLYVNIFRYSALPFLLQWTGSVAVTPTVSMSPSDLSQLLASTKLNQDSNFNYSTTLYQSISSRISIISNVDGAISALRARVAAAISRVGISVSARAQVQTLLSLSSVSANDVTLFHLSDQVNNGLAGLLTATQGLVNDATYFQNLANGVLLQISNISLTGDALVFNRTRDGQSLKTNATLAQLAANSSVSLIYSYANSSLAAKLSISASVISLAGALSTLTNASLALASGTQTMNNIMSITLDPLTLQIGSLAQQIGSSVIPLDRIASINSMATQSSQLATDAQLTTQAAVTKVQSALGLLNYTLSNLTSAQNSQALAQIGITNATNAINFINSVISTVSQKASSANDLATRTNNNISTDLAAIAVIQQTFPLLTTRIRTARGVGDFVNQSAINLATIIATSYDASNTLQAGISAKSLIIAQQKITLQSISFELNSIQQELNDLSAAYNLPGLQQVALQQVIDIQSLNSDVSLLQLQLTQIGTQLDALPVNSTYCTVTGVPTG